MPIIADTVTKIGIIAIALAVLAATALLTWHGSLDGAQFLGVVGVVVGLPAAGAAHVASVKAATNPTSRSPQ